MQPLLGFANRREVLVDLHLVRAADRAAQIIRLFENLVEDAPLQLTGLTAEEAVERERWIQLNRDRRIGVAPGNVRGVNHRVLALVEATHRLFAAQHEARYQRVIAIVSGQLLIHADATLDDAPSMQIRSGQNVARAASVSAVSLTIEQTVDNVELLLERSQRFERRPQLHLAAIPLGPPMRRRNAIADEHAGKPLRSLRLLGRDCLTSQRRHRFQPRQSNRSTKSLEQHATRNGWLRGWH